MRVGVFSDTHGDLAHLPAALDALGPLDYFLHLGDFASDAKAIHAKTDLPYYAVRGNCDVSHDEPAERVITLCSVRLFMTHGNRYADAEGPAYAAEEACCAVALCGHTHIPLLAASGSILLVNPGSLTRPIGGSRPGCALLLIDHGEVHVKMIRL